MEDKKQAAFIYCLFWVMFLPSTEGMVLKQKVWIVVQLCDNEVSMFHDLLNLRLNF